MGAVIGSLAGVVMMSKFNISVRKGEFNWLNWPTRLKSIQGLS